MRGHSWADWLDILQKTIGYGLQMQKTESGLTIFEKLAGVGKQSGKEYPCSAGAGRQTGEYPCLVESFSDSDWQGGERLAKHELSSTLHQWEPHPFKFPESARGEPIVD